MTDAAETRTTCPYCGVGCGVLVKPSDGGQHAEVRGDPDHPANYGRLCSKGSSLGETLTLDERLLYPEIDGRRASWDEALDLVATRFQDTIERHGPDSVAIYASGQMLTEDYYVANKLMKGFIGSGNMDTNSRLCMASSVAGHKRAFGSDTVPGCYEDIELADLIILVGSNFAWCHPVLHQRLLAAKEKRGARLVVIDPRATATTAAADLHLAIAPGADVALFNALFAHLASSPAADGAFVDGCTEGFEAALIATSLPPIADTARATGIPADQLTTFFDWVVETPRTITIYSQGVNQSTSGTDKVNAIINCHLVTGRIGKPGMGPFSITGQPNAMGGREVGGLANQLAAHMDFAPEDRDRVSRFWAAPNVAPGPGLKAVDMFDAVADGRIKALWIIATNPAVSMPNADHVRRAIRDCPFVVVQDVTATGDTVSLADVRLPALAWGEKSGTVTNSERQISRQRSFLNPPGECRADWDIISDVARRMGYDGFDFSSPGEVFAEHAALSAFENNGARDFDIGAHAAITPLEYDELQPFQWPAPASVEPPSSPSRMFADGRFFTASGRARFIATSARRPANETTAAFPLRLNTARVRDHWHTLTRTGKTPRLAEHIAEPYLEIHPDDATRYEIAPAAIVRVVSAYGEALLRAQIADRVAPGNLSAPMHWTERFSSAGRIDAVVNPDNDPVSGQPELKHTPVRLEPFRAGAYAFVLTRKEPRTSRLADGDYWALARAPGGWRLEVASAYPPAVLLDCLAPSCEHSIEYIDGASGLRRRAVVSDAGLQSLALISRGPVSADRAWASRLFASDLDNDTLRRTALAGRPPSGESPGPLVCSCKGVGANQIERAIQCGAGDLAAIGKVTGAGVTCGSCKPEIARILNGVVRTMARAAE